MVILSDASVSGRNGGNNVGYDSYRNVMTNSPTIDGKPDMITDALSVEMTVNLNNGCSNRRHITGGWLERSVHGLTDGWN